MLARSDLRGRELAVALAAVTDAWLEEVLAAACGEAPSDVALVAVGGYGRGELAPGSDLDLVLVHRSRGDIDRVAEAVWYPVWDGGVRLDHSVRTAREVGAAMDADRRVALGWLDARTVAGSRALGAEVARAAADKWVARAGRWIPELAAAVTARHEASGDLAFLLEPDLKQSRGGLRDARLLGALGWVGEELDGPVGVLTDARVELQRTTGRPVDRLVLQDQDAVAAALGTDSEGLMAGLAAAGREVAWLGDRAWRRAQATRRRGAGWVADPVEPGVVVRSGELHLSYGADPAADPTLALRAAAASAELDLPLSDPLVAALARSAPAPPGEWPGELLQALLRLLGTGRGAIAAWETLDHQGVVVGLLPEWAAVRNRPQRNAYHRFTVDRHLLETVAGAATLARRVARPDLLLLAALFHDIGKGRQGDPMGGARQGDHTDEGVALVARLAPRMGLPPADAATVETLVRHHLLLPEAATRRDLDDPGTAATVAAAVGDRETLGLLAALTEADARATGPTAWSPWKAGLVADLVERVGGLLEGRPPLSPPPPSEREARLLAGGRPAVDLDGGNLTVVAPRRTDLLAATAGVLALEGVSVRSATLRVSDGPMVLLSLQVAPARDILPAAGRIASDLAAALRGDVDLAAGIADQESRRPRSRPSAAAGLGGVVVRVDHQASATATLLEVHAPDRPGTLWRLAGTIALHDLETTGAIVATLGAEVVDTFYVRARSGERLQEGDERLGRAAREIAGLLGDGSSATAPR